MATGRIGTTPVLQVRWSKAPSAGTTSLSGLDDNSVSLVYSVGYEAVYRNGVLLSRTNDYTATDGTTVTLIDATIAGDIIEIFANQTIPLADTYSQTVANGKFINNTLTTTTGDIIYASAANTPARLAIGSTDQVLKVSGGIPAWSTPAGGGKVLQVVQNTNATETTIASTTMTDTSLSATITPTLATSKILVLTYQNWLIDSDDADIGASLRLVRGSTAILEPLGTRDKLGFILVDGEPELYLSGNNSVVYLDSPATTSATTYKTQANVNSTAANGRVRFQMDSSPSVMVLMEIGA